MEIFSYMVSRVTEIEAPSDEQMQQLELFKERAIELNESLKKNKIIPYYKYANSDHVLARRDSFEANTPDVEHIERVALKFRFFFADKEPTQFEKVASLIRSTARDEWAINYLDRISLWYKESMKATDITRELGNPIPNREMIKLWFNSKFFHSDFEKRAKLVDIHSTVGEGASLFQLYLAMVRCSSLIDSLYVVMHKTSRYNLVICTPNHHFRLK